MGQAGSKLESRREIQIQCSGEDQIGGRWQEPGGGLNRREPSALLKLACCRAGSALSTRMKTSSIQHHHDHRRGSRGGGGACTQASRRARESESERQHRGGELSRRAAGAANSTATPRSLGLTRWKLQNTRDASLPRHGEPAEHRWAAPTCCVPDRKQIADFARAVTCRHNPDPLQDP
jgi:hypothetical protein